MNYPTSRTGLDALLEASSAYELIDSLVAILDTQGVLRYGNRAFLQFNAAVRDSADGHHRYHSLLTCPAIASAIADSIRAGVERSIHGTFFYSPKISMQLNLVVRPVLGEREREVVGVMLTLGEESVHFDKHHLARAQEAIHTLTERIRLLSRDKISNERLLKILFKDAPFAMVLMNRDRQVIQVNKAGEGLFGISAREMMGQSCEQLVECYQRCQHCPVADRQAVIEADEITAIGSDRRDIPLLRSAMRFSDHDGTLILEAFIDLSERKQAEQALQRLSEYNRLLLNTTGEGIFGIDLDMRCTFANRAAASMLGYRQEEMIGEDVYELLLTRHEDGTPAAREELAIFTALRNGKDQRDDDSVFQCQDGKTIPVQYLCNPIREDGTVTGAVVVFRNIAESRALARRMDYLATHDSLTGLLNRRVFERRLEHAIEVAFQDNVEHVLCYVDLDQFKVVNDTCGHSAGDELLRQLGGILHAGVRKTDTFARLGGDEFGLLLEQCNLEQALEIVEKLHATLAEYRFNWEQKIFSIGASIGVVQIDRHTLESGKALSAADAACYVAKENGRNRIHVYQSDDRDLAQRRGEIQWVTKIRNALEEQRFTLDYQPIVPVTDPGQLGRYMEILVRMRDTNGSPINPGAFIPAAERYGLMPAIDQWVVTEALRWLGANYHRLHGLGLCTINLSGHSLCDQRFLDFLLQQLKWFAPPASILCFEVTETAAVANLSRAMHFTRSLKDMGCSFALDDFGSGMSSFAYLKNLPVDYLKIDGHFVRDMAHDKIDYAMVEAIHRVGSVMGIQTIAEFVEDPVILSSLKEVGVHFAQGYGLCRPQPLEKRLISG